MVEDQQKETIEKPAKTALEEMWRALTTRLSLVQIVIIIGFIFFFFWQVKYTELVPNYNNQTNTVLYNAESKVPKHNVSYTQAIWETAAMILLVFLYLRDAPTKPLREDQAKKILYDALKYKKDVLKEQEFQCDRLIVGPDVNLRNYFEKDGTPHPNLWVIGVTMIKDGQEFYYVGAIKAQEPNKGYVYKILSRKKPFTEADTCGNCGGKYTDVRVMESPELRDLKFLRKSLGRH